MDGEVDTPILDAESLPSPTPSSVSIKCAPSSLLDSKVVFRNFRVVFENFTAPLRYPTLMELASNDLLSALHSAKGWNTQVSCDGLYIGDMCII